MNQIIQSGLAWIGGLTVVSYLACAVYIGTTSVVGGRRLKHARAALHARRAPLTESEIASVDFDAELTKLTKENGR